MTTTILSQCHLSEVKWVPEPGSKAARKRASRALENRNYIKPMMWTNGKASQLNQWRAEMGATASRFPSGYRVIHTHGNAY